MPYFYTNNIALFDAVTIKLGTEFTGPRNKIVFGDVVLGCNGLASIFRFNWLQAKFSIFVKSKTTQSYLYRFRDSFQRICQQLEQDR